SPTTRNVYSTRHADTLLGNPEPSTADLVAYDPTARAGPDIRTGLGPAPYHPALGPRVIDAASRPTGMPGRDAASSIRLGRSGCSSGRPAAARPRATDCRTRETVGTSRAPSLRRSTCCKHPTRPERNRGG